MVIATTSTWSAPIGAAEIVARGSVVLTEGAPWNALAQIKVRPSVTLPSWERPKHVTEAPLFGKRDSQRTAILWPTLRRAGWRASYPLFATAGANCHPRQVAVRNRLE